MEGYKTPKGTYMGFIPNAVWDEYSAQMIGLYQEFPTKESYEKAYTAHIQKGDSS